MAEVVWKFNPERIAKKFEYKCVECGSVTVHGPEGGPLPECCDDREDHHVTALLETEPVREYMGTMKELGKVRYG